MGLGFKTLGSHKFIWFVKRKEYVMEWDPGPPPAIKTIFEQAPLNDYKNKPNRFRLERGTMYYRGRLEGSAKMIVIGHDPAVDEHVAKRILSSDARQRVRGLLSKL